MLSAPRADRAWKGMARSMPTQEQPGEDSAPRQAGRAAYAALLQGRDPGAGGETGTGPWLLLRDRTASRSADQ